MLTVLVAMYSLHSFTALSKEDAHGGIVPSVTCVQFDVVSVAEP